MIVVADSGSTKTDWRFIADKKNITSKRTAGFNPFFTTTSQMVESLNATFTDNFDHVTHVYFYGAGCSNSEKQAIISSALEQIFTQAEISVDHDLLAAAKGACQGEPGLVAILGTGSNACVFDGEEIITETRSLGYLLGDEGSGAYFGKILITDYLNDELPDDVLEIFTKKFNPNPTDILSKVYKENQPNKFLASFSPFYKEIIHTAYAEKVMTAGFKLFLDRHVLRFKGHHTMPLNFVGSVAFHFHQFLKTAVDFHELNLNYIIQTPIENLVQLHLNEHYGK